MEHYWVLLATHLAQQGRRALLAYPSQGEIPSAIRDAPIHVVWLDYGDRSAAGWRSLSETVRREGVTSLYLTDRAYARLRYAGMRHAGVRTIAVHDHTPGDRPPVSGLKGCIKSEILKVPLWSADIFIAVSEFVRQRMIENARAPAERTVVVPNGVVPFEYADTDRVWARRELCAGDGDLVIGMVARAQRVKGVDFAIHAAENVLAQDSRALFVFVGDGPDLDRFRVLASERRVADRFRFLGRRADARRLMAGFDLGIHPSAGEVGYCLAILEMMNAGLPVVVPDLASVRGATEPGVTGLWYPANESGACAEAILALLSDRSRRESLGRAAREQSLTRFSLAHADAAFLSAVASRL